MQFLVLGYDGSDPGAAARRQAAREAHLASARKSKSEGKMLLGAALLDDDGRMIGSVCVMEFASRGDLDQWLASDPYVAGDVWRRVEVRPCRVSI